MRSRTIALVGLMIITVTVSTRLKADTGTCGGASITLPFTDVPSSSVFFCSIAEAFFSGLTNGTTPTTYNPSDPVTREQMAAFITRSQDSVLRRGSKSAALRQFWTTTPRYVGVGLGVTPVGSGPQLIKSDGADLWVANQASGTVSRVRASDGKLLDTWTGASSATAVLVAMGRVFVTGADPSGKLYMINPTQPAGAVTLITTALGNNPIGIAFDGSRIWTANLGTSVSIITPGSSTPWPVTNVSAGTHLQGILFDGSNIWATDSFQNKLLKLDQNGAIIQTVNLGASPAYPAFDGTNIWVPSSDNSLTVVRASTGTIVGTLAGNGLNDPLQAAFDGKRILVTNYNGNSVSLWNASDLTPIGTFPTGANTAPLGACSDGSYFWITLNSRGMIGRF